MSLRVMPSSSITVDEQIERDLSVLRGVTASKLAWTVETHAHADHITEARASSRSTLGARGTRAGPEGCGITTAAVQLKDGDSLSFGAERIKALHTRRVHTARGACVTCGATTCSTGDTLARSTVAGRTDFQSGSAEALYRSITQILFAAPGRHPPSWPAHDYQGARTTTIGAEKARQSENARQDPGANSSPSWIALVLPKPKRIDERCRQPHVGLAHDAGGGALLDGASRGGLRRRVFRRSSPTSGGVPATPCWVDVRHRRRSASGWDSFPTPCFSRGSSGRDEDQ
jgi:glyoxylase-like metal-dependent hydrolase (beta-lactamase superfamily II)